MHFFARYHVTRTHRSTLMTAAFANTDAAFERIGKTAFVLGVLEISTHLRRIVFFSITQFLIAMVRQNHFARIHFTNLGSGLENESGQSGSAVPSRSESALWRKIRSAANGYLFRVPQGQRQFFLCARTLRRCWQMPPS